MVDRIGRERLVNEVELPAVELERARTAQRLSHYGHAAQLLAQHNALQSGLTIEQAAAAIFAIGHPETYRALVIDGDWTDDDWAAWAQAALETSLLQP